MRWFVRAVTRMWPPTGSGNLAVLTAFGAAGRWHAAAHLGRGNCLARPDGATLLRAAKRDHAGLTLENAALLERYAVRPARSWRSG